MGPGTTHEEVSQQNCSSNESRLSVRQYSLEGIALITLMTWGNTAFLDFVKYHKNKAKFYPSTPQIQQYVISYCQKKWGRSHDSRRFFRKIQDCLEHLQFIHIFASIYNRHEGKVSLSFCSVLSPKSDTEEGMRKNLNRRFYNSISGYRV
ncbi:hypothetical protein YC2023_113250 [Brassica napus]